jgi:hypothetical protein
VMASAATTVSATSDFFMIRSSLGFVFRKEPR